jgi:hypothetical protein
MPLIKQRKEPPSWGTRLARSFAEQLPTVAGNVLYQTIGGLVREQFQKAREARAQEARKAQEQRAEERRLAREKRQEERFRGTEERAAERQKMRDVTRTLGAKPGEKLTFMADPTQYQAPTTRAIGETVRAAVPGMAREMAGAMTPMLPGQAPSPEQSELQRRREALKKATAGTKTPYTPPGERMGLDLSEEEMGKLAPAGRPMAPPIGGLAGFGAEQMAKAATAPRGTKEAGIREAGIAMRGLPSAEEKLTAKQKEARDPLIRRARLQSIWDKLRADERRLHAKMRYKRDFTQYDRDLLNAIQRSKERLNPFIVAGEVQPSADLPIMEDLPYYRMTGPEQAPPIGGVGRQPVAPPPGVSKKEWFDAIKAGAARGRTPQQVREDYRRKFGK